MQTTLIVIGVLIVTFFIFRVIVMAKMKNTPMVADHVKVLTLTDKNFQQQTNNTLILFKNGAEVNRFVGIKSKDFLLKEIAKVS